MDFREEFGRIPPTLAFYSNSIVAAYYGRHHDGGPNKRVTALYAANSPYLTTLFNGSVSVAWLMVLAAIAAVICFGWGFFGSHWIWIGAALSCGVSVYMRRRVGSSLMQIRTLILASEVLASDFAGWGSRFPDAAEWARGWVGRTTTDIRLLDLYIPPDLRPAIECEIQPPSLLEEKLAAKSGEAIPQTAADLAHDRAASGRTRRELSVTEAAHAVRGKLKGWVASFFVICGGLLFLGFGVETRVSMRDYAVVFVDDTSKAFIAPQCMAAWQNTPRKTFGLMRRTTAGEAGKLHYQPDYDCIQTGAFSQDGRSLSGILLEKLGILPQKKYWWDMPFRMEDGVIYPGTTPVAAVRAKVEPDGTPEFCYAGNPRRPNGDKPDLTPSQMDICGHFAALHLKANGTMPTETPDQLIHRWSDENGACSVPVSIRKGGPKRAPTQDEVAACVDKTELARR